MYKLSWRSNYRLRKLHPDMKRVVKRAIEITEQDFSVLEVDRKLSRQRNLVASGASRTMNSRHLLKVPKNNPEYGPVSHAVDLGAYVKGLGIRWDWSLYHKIAAAMKQAAKEEGVEIVWGGDWKSFPDGPHFELSWKRYPVYD